jgi:hypothetical protein
MYLLTIFARTSTISSGTKKMVAPSLRAMEMARRALLNASSSVFIQQSINTGR